MRDLWLIFLVEDSFKDVELMMVVFVCCQLFNDVIYVCDGVEVLDYLCCEGKFVGVMYGGLVVVLLDFKLFKVNGFEVLEQVCGDVNLSSMLVVMLIFLCEEQDLVCSYELGVNVFVVKLVDFKEFFDVIQGLGMFWGIINQLLLYWFNGLGQCNV